MSETTAGELAIRHLLKGGKGHYGCYSSDTEVLTERGWMLFSEVYSSKTYDGGDCVKLLAVDPNSGSCQYEAPSAVQKVKFNSEDTLYQVKSQYLDFAVTHDHRMVISSRTKGGGSTPWRIEAAENVQGKPVRYLLASQLVDPTTPQDFSQEKAFRLAGFFVGDGVRSQHNHPRTVRFRLRRHRKIEYLHSLGYDVTAWKGDRYTINDVDIAKWIHENFSSSKGKVIPAWMLTIPRNLVLAFFDGLKNSDGTRIMDTSWAYDSSDKELIDMIQAMAHTNGFSANMNVNNKNDGNENHRIGWRVNISQRITKLVETCQKGRSIGVVEDSIAYSGYVYCATVSTGVLMVRRNNKVIVLGNCCEHPQIVLSCGYWPHSVLQQARTHRNLSFDCQSMRYTGKNLAELGSLLLNTNNWEQHLDKIEAMMYVRPVGRYTNREGKKYDFTEEWRMEELEHVATSLVHYAHNMERGMAEEDARGRLCFDYRQHFVVSGNARAIMHFLDMRAKRNAQPECTTLAEFMFDELKSWMPEIGSWYEENRLYKGKLAP